MIGFCKLFKREILSEADCYYCEITEKRDYTCFVSPENYDTVREEYEKYIENFKSIIKKL